MNSTITTANQIATFINLDFGIASLVTQVKKGYAVTLLDTDAEMIVATRIYPVAMLAQAINYAQKIANV
jgi:ATP phosphoribosyltransferase